MPQNMHFSDDLASDKTMYDSGICRPLLYQYAIIVSAMGYI